jgi:choline-sulfatase
MPTDNLTRRRFGQALAALGVPATGAAEEAGRTRRPNIVFICSDQHSGLVMGCNGHELVCTPNMDRLAARGIHYRNAYCGSPVCVPARASLMTGMFASDVGSYCNSTPFDGRVPTWATYLRDAGYHCWGTGKLDLAAGRDYGLKEVNTSHGHHRRPDICSLFRRPLCYRVDERDDVNGQFRDRRHGDENTIEQALRFLREETPRQGRPWAMWVGLLLPHPPFVGHLRFRNLYPPYGVRVPNIPPGYLERRHVALQALASYRMISVPVAEERVRMARAAYYAMVTELDELVGKLIDEIERAGQWRNTVLIYTSDHGEMLGEHGLWLKNTLLEGAARVPLILAGGGLPEGKVVEHPVAHVDLVATLLDVAGIPIPDRLRGRSLLPLAAGRAGDHPGIAFSESHCGGNCTGSYAIRKGDWKYIHFSWYESLLFNLKEDPGELNDLAGDPRYGDVRRDLYGRLKSLIDPEQVTEQAFRTQERRLEELVQSKSPQQLLEQDLARRLGEGQARTLLNKLYRT